MVPPVRLDIMLLRAGVVGRLVGAMVTKVPTPAAGAVPFDEESVGVPVE